MSLSDTHCHLNLNQFDIDRKEVIQRAKDVGVNRILVPGIDLETSRLAIALAEEFPEVYAAVGVHPNTVEGWQGDSYELLKELAIHPRVAAIGEIGLDNHWNDTEPAYQEQTLREQLRLAAEVQKPVLLHSRDALGNLLPILLEWSKILSVDHSPLQNRSGVLHAFEGSLEQARQAIQIGFFIGLAGPITFRNAPDKHQLARNLPLDKIIIETDAPYLTPHPYRGRRNEPAHVIEVARALADLQKIDLETIIETTTRNAETLFNWSR